MVNDTYSSNVALSNLWKDGVSSNVGLSSLLKEGIATNKNKLRKSSAPRATNVDRFKNDPNGTRDSSPFISNEMASSVVSLTPSAITSPTGSKSFSPTGTPLNSPLCSPPPTPPNERSHTGILEKQISPDEPGNALLSSEGLVYGFFSSLKSALYGEQQKEAKTLIRKKRKKDKQKQFKRLGILEKVEEVGVENLLSNNISSNNSLSSAPSSYYLSGSKTHKNLNFYANDEQDCDDSSWCEELEDIAPGSLTVDNRGLGRAPTDSDRTVGQLAAPSFSSSCRPSLNPNELGHIPSTRVDNNYPYSSGYHTLGDGMTIGGRGPGRIISPGEKRPTVRGGTLGIPGHPGTDALTRAGVRPDLGYVPSGSAIYNDKQITSTCDNYTQYQFKSSDDSGGFIGNIASMFFGRKGGLF